MAADRTISKWLISEYVYNADGSFAGIMQQKSRTEKVSNDRIRLIQQCSPGDVSSDHPAAELAGESVFEMSREGRRLRFHGPDMIGTGLLWGVNTVIVRGVWARFGHNFASYVMTISPERQLSCRHFYNAGELIASMIGIAVPDMGKPANDYPKFTGSFYPQEVARVWAGTTDGFNAAGESLLQSDEARRYHFSERRGWAIHESSRVLKLDDMGNRYGIQEEPGDYGIGKRSGWLFEIEHFVPPVHYSRSEILDNDGGNLVVLAHTHEDDTLTYVSVTRLKPGT